MHKENINTEYKCEYSENIKKSIIAFANTLGGTISIGIDDARQVIGIDNVDATMLQITNVIRDDIKPDVSMFTKCEHKVLERKNIVAITVQKGTATPYYLAHKGIRPEGVFIRQGASSVPASETAILNMIRLSAGDSYEGNRSLNQELTFTTMKQEFADAGLALGESQFKSLQLIGSDGLYTNLALLLSEQCVHSVKLAVFEGNNKEIFMDRQEFTGSLFIQLSDCFTAIDRFNKRGAEFDGAKPEENPYSLLTLVLRDDAEQGDADAQYSLGLFFLTEKAQEEEINPKEAIKWLRLAASQGHEKAQILLANMHLYFTKEICGLDEEESMSWIQRAVEQGNIAAIGLLGALSNDIEIITSAAEAGDPSACFNLGMAYSRGADIAADKQKAFHWMLKAAEAGYSVAQRYIAYDYFTGTGTHKSLTQAKQWLMKAMEQEYENEQVEE